MAASLKFVVSEDGIPRTIFGDDIGSNQAYAELRKVAKGPLAELLNKGQYVDLDKLREQCRQLLKSTTGSPLLSTISTINSVVAMALENNAVAVIVDSNS